MTKARYTIEIWTVFKGKQLYAVRDNIQGFCFAFGSYKSCQEVIAQFESL